MLLGQKTVPGGCGIEQPPLSWTRAAEPPTPSPLAVLETAVELALALLAGPRAALEAEFAQVLLEVLVVHGAVVLGFTVHLWGGGEKQSTTVAQNPRRTLGSISAHTNAQEVKKPTAPSPKNWV